MFDETVGFAVEVPSSDEDSYHEWKIEKAETGLARAEAELRAQTGSRNVFKSGAGRFWGLVETRDYMSARFAVARALIEANTEDSVERALEHLIDMLRLSRSDKLGVRDIIPHLMLQLGREQECYDFIKWWATVGSAGNYNFDDTTIPYLNIHGANVFEPIDIFCSDLPNLSHLVALTLLKLRLYLDLEAFESEDDYGFPTFDSFPDRPVGDLARRKMQIISRRDYDAAVEKLKKQYRRLCQVVHDANPHFWEPLATEETATPPSFYSPRSKEEAAFVLGYCQRSWQDTEDALDMINADTASFAAVYQAKPATASASATLEQFQWTTTVKLKKWRGTGKAFPSEFTPLPSSTTPIALFPPTRICSSRAVRLVHRHDQGRVLVYTDGACINNGQPGASAGWGVVLKTPENNQQKNNIAVSGRLEEKGPFGDWSVATSNRAELRAVIGALRLRDWKAEGHDCLVIATDSSYVVEGATSWAKNWIRRGWTTRTGDSVKNKDLWQLLLGETERWKDKGLCIHLWKIPRELNAAADAAAKKAAYDGVAPSVFRDAVLPSSQTSSNRRVLGLCLEYKSVFEDFYESLVPRIASKATMERVTTPASAIAMLTKNSPPSVILVGDGALVRQKKVWECLIDCMHGGSTVVLAGCFCRTVSQAEVTRIFVKLGIPWKMGSCSRETIKLQESVVGSCLARRLPLSCGQKTQFLVNVGSSTAWYIGEETSNETAVAFAKIGLGRLGYIGDVNGEQGSEKVVLAMCGLLD